MEFVIYTRKEVAQNIATAISGSNTQNKSTSSGLVIQLT